MYRVDANPELAQFDCQRVGESDDPELRRTVVAAARNGLDAGRRADVDDRPAVARRDHGGHRGPDGVPDAGQVGVDGLLPLFRRDLPQPAPIEHPGIGHHDVEATELLDALRDDALLAVGVANVEGLGEDLAALALDQADGLGEIFRCRWLVAVASGDRTAGVDGDDVGSGAGQSKAVRASLASGCARDVGNLACQRLCGARHADCSFTSVFAVECVERRLIS